jgi:hypothetical protein
VPVPGTVPTITPERRIRLSSAPAGSGDHHQTTLVFPGEGGVRRERVGQPAERSNPQATVALGGPVRVWVAFSAVHRAEWSGKWMFSSLGASVPGVIWNTIRIPSTVSLCAVRMTVRVGG